MTVISMMMMIMVMTGDTNCDDDDGVDSVNNDDNDSDNNDDNDSANNDNDNNYYESNSNDVSKVRIKRYRITICDANLILCHNFCDAILVTVSKNKPGKTIVLTLIDTYLNDLQGLVAVSQTAVLH